MKTQKKYYSEINIARGIAVLLVLLGHSFPDAQTGFQYEGAWWVFDFCYAFHMALFFILSGFVMGGKIYQKNILVVEELVKKGKRLLVPYLVYSVITTILKFFMNEYANNALNLSELWMIILGKNPNGGLWYLWTLFIISVIVLLLGKVIAGMEDKWKTIILCGVGLAGYIIWKWGPSTFMGNVFKYILFFNLGMILWRYYDKVKKYFYPVLALVVLVIVFIVECPGLHIKTEYIMTALLGSYAILAFAILVNKKDTGKLFAFFDFAGNYSYDIYMMSYFVQVPIRVVCWRILGWNYWIDVLLMFVLGFILPCVVSKFIIRKVGILRKLFIGDWR